MSISKFMMALILTYGGIATLTLFPFFVIIFGFHAFGQSTSTIPEPMTQPTPNLQYVPQKAYIITQYPNGQVQAIPTQDDNDMTGQAGGLLGLVGLATAVWSKISGSRDNKATSQEVKATNNALLGTQTSQIDLAKFAYSLNPEKANALNDMPSIKIENLEQQKKDLQEKAVKS